MHKLFCPAKNISKSKAVLIDKAQVHHLKDVLRIQPGETIGVFDEQGNDYLCLVEEVGRDRVLAKIEEKKSTSQQIRVTIACAIPKKAKMDEIIDKLTQLGAARFIPLVTERVIVRLNTQKKSARKLRWEKIAQSAAQQCQRSSIPVIEPIQEIKKFLASLRDFDLKLIPTLTGRRQSLKSILTRAQPKNILVLIGPEGDFTPEEVRLAEGAGCVPVTLGDTVLRVDTAAIAVTSFIKLYADS